jgi:signal transduction histidine kinase
LRPPSATGQEQVAADHVRLIRQPLFAELLNSVLEPAMVLNPFRQVVFANDNLLSALQASQSAVLGRRPGELLQCIHAGETAGGCGTTRACSQCGAARAIVASVAHGRHRVEECRITCSSENHGLRAMDLRVSAAPLDSNQRRFTVVAIRDITDEKRRAVLERLFFHDVLNTAGGLQGLMSLCPDVSPEEKTELAETASRLTDNLIEEIRAYRDFVAAERGDLGCALKRFDAAPLLSRLHALYRTAPVAEGKCLPPPRLLGSTMIYSDEILLSRVIGNLLKNALEAAPARTPVWLTFEGLGPQAKFSVHNQGCMPREVQLQVFQRSFSTKASSGRGLGTYSVKLITEQYLGGQAGFRSSQEDGTTFFVTLPTQPEECCPHRGGSATIAMPFAVFQADIGPAQAIQP